MTHRSRKLLDIAHEAPCFLNLVERGCSEFASVPCHSDQLEDGRGGNFKSEDCLAVPGCPACHAVFTREHLGRQGYFEVHARAHKKYTVWLHENGKLKVAA